MREWTEYYNSPVRGKVLNVISLEFSNTRFVCSSFLCFLNFFQIKCVTFITCNVFYFSLSELVACPKFVRNISWAEHAWPKKSVEDRYAYQIDGSLITHFMPRQNCVITCNKFDVFCFTKCHFFSFSCLFVVLFLVFIKSLEWLAITLY